MKKYNAEELAKKIYKLKETEELKFIEPNDNIIFGVQRMDWNDNDIILIGGHHTSTYCCDLTFACGDEDKINVISEVLKEIFDGWNIECVKA